MLIMRIETLKTRIENAETKTNYIVYTDNSLDEDGNTQVFYFKNATATFASFSSSVDTLQTITF